jgi:shikimate dehydrogenase
MRDGPDRYAVLGNPVGHSKSPRIHGLFAEQTGQVLSYEAMQVEPGHFASAAGDFRDQGGRGLNITVPFKEDAWRWVDVLSERAQRAGAVNTIVFEPDGASLGDNTDGVGLVTDLVRNHGVGIRGRRILVLGAGGAVRGVLQPLMVQEPEHVVLANRTAARALKLAQDFRGLGKIQGGGFQAITGLRFDLIINGTSAGLQGSVPPLEDDVLAVGGVCYDMVYGDQPTAFVRWGWAHDAAKALDGLGMLVEQAAESFQLWRGVRPETDSVIQTLRAG